MRDRRNNTPRRQSWGDEPSAQTDADRPGQDRFSAPRSESPLVRRPDDDGVEVTGTVKWFNPDKGYGFVEIPGREDCFLHIRTLEAAGSSYPAAGATVEGRARFGEKATIVSVSRIDESTIAPATQPQSRPAARPRIEVVETVRATVKFFDVGKGFGFLKAPEYDVFVHAKALQKGGVEDLRDGDELIVEAGRGDRGMIALSVRRP